MNTITRDEAIALVEAVEAERQGPFRGLRALKALHDAAPALAHTVVALHDRIAELEATLAAERGDPAGAVSEDWVPNGDGWINPAGTFSSDAGRHVRPAGRNAYHGLEDGWTKAMTWYWQVDQRVDGLLMRGRGGQGWAPTAREAMRAADAAVTPRVVVVEPATACQHAIPGGGGARVICADPESCAKHGCGYLESLADAVTP